MHIEWIALTDYRNFRTLSYTPAPNLNVLTGLNAQGKTNLLEGLAVLVVGRSFRGAKSADLPRWDAAGAVLVGEIRRGELSRVLRRTVSQCREDGAWAIAGEGCPWGRVIAFGWQDLAILSGAPEARRNFMDGFSARLFPAHASALARYRRILARRNRLLETAHDGASLRGRLQPWNEQLARVGMEVVGRRREAVSALQKEVDRLYPELGGLGTARLEYRSGLEEGAGEDGFLRALEARVGDEVRRGQTLTGPHRDDLLIEVDGRDMRVVGSRGQQRLLALLLRLAEAGPVREAVGSTPILLLDDALSEIDPVVQARVLGHVARAGQVFLTTAAAEMPSVMAEWWEVKGGRVSEMGFARARGVA